MRLVLAAEVGRTRAICSYYSGPTLSFNYWPGGPALPMKSTDPLSSNLDHIDEAPGQIEIAASDGAGQRLDRYLAAKVAGVSRSRIQKWIVLGAVTCEQRALVAKTRLRGDEALVVEPQPLAADSSFVAEPVEFEVLAQTRSFYVVNKPVGLVVHPGAGNWHGTLMNGLLHQYPGLANLPRAGIVHRLDKNTSGLLVVAATESAREQLIGQLADRSLSRQYLAICAGHVVGEQVLDGSIGRDPSNRLRMTVRADGKLARTTARPLATGSIDGQAITLLHCRLSTGRTHQIRVHLSAAGHPLIGDSVYGGPACGVTRQMLHAWRLSLSRPVDGDSGAFTSTPPTDFLNALELAGLDLPLSELIDASE